MEVYAYKKSGRPNYEFRIKMLDSLFPEKQTLHYVTVSKVAILNGSCIGIKPHNIGEGRGY